MLTVQNIIFKFSSLPEHMFYQAYGNDLSVLQNKDVNSLKFSSFDGISSLEFLGIFNAFPAEHFFQNTTAKNVYLKLDFSGSIDSVKVFKKTQWNNEIILDKSHPEEGKLILGPFQLAEGTKRYSFSISTREYFTLNCASWLVDSDNLQEASVDISITTFKKENYVTSNVNSVLDYGPLNDFDFRVIVVDNGSTLGIQNFHESERLVLINQANLGGTGGFMRGLSEAHHNKTKYILFMDDDILLSPEIIFRAITIAQIAKAKTAFGGMMLHLTKKDKIHEQGGRLPWKVNDFFKAINDGDYLSNLSCSQYDNLYSEGNPDFSGWWFYMAEVSETPFLPNLFFKWDDICSSLFLQKNGIKLSVFPSVFVWHEDFDIKRHLFMTDYLSMRNEVLSFAFLDTPKEKIKISFRRTFAVVLRDILMWDYNRASIRVKALEDVLEYKNILSPKFVLDGNGDYPVKLGREYTPELMKIPQNVDIYFEQENNKYPRGISKTRLFKLMMRSLTLFYPYKKKVLNNGKVPMLSMNNGNYPIIYPYKKYFLYNSDGHVGYFCEYSFSKTISLLWKLFKVINNVKAEYFNIVSDMKKEKFDKSYWESIFNFKSKK